MSLVLLLRAHSERSLGVGLVSFDYFYSMRERFLALLALTIFGLPSPAAARPWLYVSTFSYGGNSEKCVNQAKAALEAQGFTKDVQIEWNVKNDKSQGGRVEGVLSSSPVRAKIECNSKDGITGLGVSGLDNDLTYAEYSKLHDASW